MLPPEELVLLVVVGAVEVVGELPVTLLLVVVPVLPLMPNQARSAVSCTGTVWPTLRAE